MKPFKHVETWGNGANIVEPIYPDGPVPLNPGDELVMGHKTFHLGTPATYAAESGRFHEERANGSAKDNANHPYIFGLCSIICAGPHPDNGKTFIKVKPGMTVLVDGKYYTLHSAMNDNLDLIAKEAEA